jgi:hypothetical protein
LPTFKISQLTTATAVSATNQFEINQNAASRSLEVSVLSSYVRGQDTLVPVNVSVSTANAAVSITQTGTGPGINVLGGVRFRGATAGFVGLAAPASVSSVTYTLPAADGTSGQVLITDGAGVLSFTSPGATLSGVTDSASPFETALGYQAGNVTTGINNTFIGYQSGLLNTTGTNNTAVGFAAFDANTTGSSNVALGSNALGANTTGISNTAVGTSALLVNTTGAANVAVGSTALDANTTGSNNTAVGTTALGANTIGNNNAAVGWGALSTNTTGNDNTAVGFQALYLNSTGINNVALGSAALAVNTTGTNNTAVGFGAGDAVTIGTQNTILGSQAGSSGTNDLTTGSNNILIGYNAAASSATVSNEVTLGNTSITSTRLRGMVELNAAMFEAATITATAATGTINYDARTQSVLYYTSNASGNWTLNIRAASGVSLDSVMSTGESMTVAFLVTNGATAYYQTGFQVDGSAVTPKWQGGTAPSAGNASSIDVYVITVIKTGAATFTALASQTRFA